MRKQSRQIGGVPQKPVLSSGDEPLLIEEGLAAGSAVSPKTLAWPSPESGQVTGPALNAGADPPRPLPAVPRLDLKVTSPAPRVSGALRDRNREVVGDQKKSIPSAADETLLTEQQLAARWQVSQKTLRNARMGGRLISFVKLGRLIRYRLSIVIAVEEENSRRSTSGAEE